MAPNQCQEEGLMRFKLTTLCENYVPAGGRGLLGEHGLAILIETPEETILFDTGQGLGLVRNAQILGKDLCGVGQVVLSHGHYDHSGGLGYLLAMGTPFTLTAHPRCFERKVGRFPGRADAEIGCPVAREAVEEGATAISLSTAPTRLATGVTTTGEIPLENDFESVDQVLLREDDGQLVADEVLDDLSLVLETRSGLVVLLGCAHRGVINNLRRACEVTGRSDIHTVVGGMHLSRASAGQMERTLEELRRLKVRCLVPGHCTGPAALARMRSSLGEAVQVNQVGSVFELGSD